MIKTYTTLVFISCASNQVRRIAKSLDSAGHRVVLTGHNHFPIKIQDIRSNVRRESAERIVNQHTKRYRII